MNNNFLKTIDQLSFKKVISISLFIAILLGVPVGTYLVGQQTRIRSHAAYQKPKPVNSTDIKATPGPLPTQAPAIGRVFPWVGKVGDIAWLQGKNFGTNPVDKRLTIGGVTVSENDIASWEDTQIQAIIPQGALQGGSADIRVGSYPNSQSLPMVIYDTTAKVKLHIRNNVLTAENAGVVVKALIWTGDDQVLTQNHNVDINPLPTGETMIFDTQGLPLLSVLLLDGKGNIVPYYVDPIEFNF